MSALGEVATSPLLTLALAALNVVQTVWLAEIASRSRQRRAEDRQEPSSDR